MLLRHVREVPVLQFLRCPVQQLSQRLYLLLLHQALEVQQLQVGDLLHKSKVSLDERRRGCATWRAN